MNYQICNYKSEAQKLPIDIQRIISEYVKYEHPRKFMKHLKRIVNMKKFFNKKLSYNILNPLNIMSVYKDISERIKNNEYMTYDLYNDFYVETENIEKLNIDWRKRQISLVNIGYIEPGEYYDIEEKYNEWVKLQTYLINNKKRIKTIYNNDLFSLTFENIESP